MIKAVIRFSLKQRIFYNLLFIALIVAGSIAISDLSAERFPNVNFGEVIISAYYPGAAPHEVEAMVTRKLEEALEEIKNIEWISSTSYHERASIRLKFIDDTDYEALYDEVRFKVLSIIDELPDGIDPPIIQNTKIEDFLPVVVVNLAGVRGNRALALMASEMKANLQLIEGVQQVVLNGEFVREFHIMLDAYAMTAHGVTFDDVVTAIKKANVSFPAGNFENDTSHFVIKVDEKFYSREQIANTIIRADSDGSFLRIGNVISQARANYRNPIVISSANGKDSIALRVLKSADGNAIEIRRQVQAVVDEYTSLLQSEDVEIILTQDSTPHIEDGLNTLSLNLAMGVVLVAIVIWYFMGVRNAGLITIGIPFAFIITMLLMQLTGNSLNEISLFALVLVAGIVVDDAIVVTESIYRHVQAGKPLVDSIVDGTEEVALPVISATTTTLAAFLPMLIMTGSTGEFFAQIPKAVSFAIVASLIECLFILPVHYFDFGLSKTDRSRADIIKEENVLVCKGRIYVLKLLRFTMRHRYKSLFTVFVTFILALLVFVFSATGKFPLVKIKFFPDDYTLYYVDVVGPASTPNSVIHDKVKSISNFIMSNNREITQSVAGFAGYYINESYTPVYGNNYGTVTVTLSSKYKLLLDDPKKYLDEMRDQLKTEYEKDGYIIRVHAQKDGPRSGKSINVRITGSNVTSVDQLAADIFEYINRNSELRDNLVELEYGGDQPKQIFRFQINEERVHEYGLDLDRVAHLAASVMDGRYVGKYRFQDEEVNLKVLIDKKYLKAPKDSLVIPLVEHHSGPVRLGDLAQVITYFEPANLRRYQSRPMASISANIRAGSRISSAVIVDQINQRYKEVRSQYPGVTLQFGGEHNATQRSYKSLLYAFTITLLLMYIILATQFQSYVQPLIILSAIVFSIIGVIFGKLFTQTLFTVNSFIALIGVAGVVINGSLILIDYLNKRYNDGCSRNEVIEMGVSVRFRPIMLTTLTTTLALLPMAVGVPYYSQTWGPMASTFVTGLATATVLTLIIVPVQWDLLQDWYERRGIRNAKNFGLD